MASPATCIVSAVVRRPTASLAVAATGKRTLSTRALSHTQSSSYTTPTNNNRDRSGSSSITVGSQSPTISSAGGISNQRRSYSSMQTKSAIQNNKNRNYIKNNNTIATSSSRAFSSSKRDFYDILNIGKNADKGEIKKAYFKLAKKYHPDTNKVRIFLLNCRCLCVCIFCVLLLIKLYLVLYALYYHAHPLHCNLIFCNNIG